eukprot:Skav229855  [mRNA]  locus=scaffold148:52700:57870:+ [translate_table: standard]
MRAEHTPRADKYNRKLMKYYIEYEEGDEELDEDIEREIQEDIQAGIPTQPSNSNPTTKDLVSTIDALAKGPSASLTCQRFQSQAQGANLKMAREEYVDLKKFGDSLLSRVSKVNGLIGQLESETSGKDQETSECKRVQKPAACSYLVENAKAQVAESQGVSRIVREFADISLAHAEDGCHRLFKKYGYSAPVQVDTVKLAEGNLGRFPYVKMSNWVRLLLDTNRLHRQLTGVATWEQMEVTLSEFWSRYRQLHPQHEIFSSDLDFRHAVPVFSHTDEGRSYKHAAIWVLSTHGCIGRGTKEYVDKKKHLLPLARRSMGLNFLGSTWSNQFMFCTMLREVATEHPGSMQKLLEIYAEDMAMLARDGVSNKRGDRHVWLVHLANKGDLPALSKVAGLKRNHAHVPRAAASKKFCQGICHFCLAGRESARPETTFPYEDTSLHPKWGPTFEQELPWETEPAVLKDLPMNPVQRASFFVTDVWHNFHLGLSKHFFASSIISAIERLDPFPMGNDYNQSVDGKLAWFTDDFAKFCRLKGITPYLTEISRETMTFPSSKVCPVGRWSKGSVATNFMLYFEHFCDHHVVGKTDDPVLTTAALRTRLVSIAMG